MKILKPISLIVCMLALLLPVSSFAQSKLKSSHKLQPAVDVRHPHPDAPMQGSAAALNLDTPNPYATARGDNQKQVYIGETYYPLQTNGSVQNRLVLNPNGSLSGTWTQSLEGTAAATDRGTGFNTWMPDAVEADFPVGRLESLRCGWPALATIAGGLQSVISHATATNPYSLNIMTKTEAATEWTETNAPFDTPTGILWPKSIAGAANGNSVHAIAVTTPTAFDTNGGAIYEGMDAKLLYYRSLNGGQTWDITDQELPGLDSTFYGGISADSYSIISKGDIIVIGVFDSWGDVAMWKSLDNGSTWTKKIAKDFPIDGYRTDAGYTFEETGMLYDSLTYPDSLAIFTCDGSGSVAIDANDNVHMVFGDMFVVDNDLGDGNTSYYPGVSGMSYWNETMEEGTAETMEVIDDALDRNGNDTLDIVADIPIYFSSLTSFPSLVVDEENTLYLVYSGIMEDFLDPVDNQNLRHILVTKTSDMGATWIEPYDVINEESLLFPELLPTIECVYSYALPQLVNDRIHLTYQQDDRPGHSVSGDNDPIEPNNIIYLSVRKNFEEPPVAVEEIVLSESFDLSITPNPAKNQTLVNYTLIESGDVELSVFNIAGQQIMNHSLKNQSAGEYNQTLDLSNMATGAYILRFETNNQVTSQKLIIE